MLPESDARILADAFKALGHPTRLALLRRIIDGEYCVSRLQTDLGHSQPSISQHLGILRDRGLVVPVRKGNRTCYRPRDDRVRQLLELAEEVLGPGRAVRADAAMPTDSDEA